MAAPAALVNLPDHQVVVVAVRLEQPV